MMPDESDLQQYDFQTIFSKLAKYEIKIQYDAGESENPDKLKEEEDGFATFYNNQFK